MHPNLSKFRPTSSDDNSARLNTLQSAMVIGLWATLFVLGYTLLP